MEWIVSDTPQNYEATVSAMEERVGAIRAGAADDLVWLLEHPPLYTAGTSADPADLLTARFPVFQTGRGGEYTYHGPGQRVAYVMLDLKKRQQVPDIKKYVCQLEEWMIRSLAHFGIKGERRDGRIGIWVVTPAGEKKIAAVGVRIRHWVTYHGVAINIHPDLTHFGGIIPCGIQEYGVTSLQDLGKSISMNEFDSVLKQEFEGVFGSLLLCKVIENGKS
ncbi:MAG TPA: lipoyl(octanoyl) transferase LipB [Micavibrio sp.]|nr:lipoyl(octanoyl) transferase LipB [Micavibrio sp.]